VDNVCTLRVAALTLCGFWVITLMPAQAQGVSATICHSYSAMVGTSLQLQQQGHPMDTALRMVSRVWEPQPTLAGFLEASVRAIYGHPAGMSGALESGRWQQACEQHMMER